MKDDSDGASAGIFSCKDLLHRPIRYLDKFKPPFRVPGLSDSASREAASVSPVQICDQQCSHVDHRFWKKIFTLIAERSDKSVFASSFLRSCTCKIC